MSLEIKRYYAREFYVTQDQQYGQYVQLDDYATAIADLAAARAEIKETAERIRADLNAARAELGQYKQSHDRAIECVDRVFQVRSDRPPPLLPDFLTLGDDKFEGVEALAKEYIASQAECDRLKAGQFTDDEFQTLCHLLPAEKYKPEDFCDGCEAYQVKLFGWSPIAQLRTDLAAANVRIKTMGEECARLKQSRDGHAADVTEMCQVAQGLRNDLTTLRTKHDEAVALLRRWSLVGIRHTPFENIRTVPADTQKFLAAHDAEAKAEAKGGR